MLKERAIAVYKTVFKNKESIYSKNSYIKFINALAADKYIVLLKATPLVPLKKIKKYYIKGDYININIDNRKYFDSRLAALFNTLNNNKDSFIINKEINQIAAYYNKALKPSSNNSFKDSALLL